eukprot:TRINITY_DN23710_c0_g1_i1.p1 TRINITY_DN23710_c0_g1~~TRINITY_DN23710_c0_g1_i1.p1  ORF type:complete len:309 (+),score=45.05 TRINITY_DN23710_c0_g1_i1:52-978(+)
MSLPGPSPPLPARPRVHHSKCSTTTELPQTLLHIIDSSVDAGDQVPHVLAPFALPDQTRPKQRVSEYVRRFLRKTQAPTATLWHFAVLLGRLLEKHRVVLNWRTAHQCCLALLVVAGKSATDIFLCNAYCASAGGVTLQKLNALEVHVLNLLDWRVVVSTREWRALMKLCAQAAPAPRCDDDAKMLDAALRPPLARAPKPPSSPHKRRKPRQPRVPLVWSQGKVDSEGGERAGASQTDTDALRASGVLLPYKNGAPSPRVKITTPHPPEGPTPSRSNSFPQVARRQQWEPPAKAFDYSSGEHRDRALA